jgi:methyl coenzyme M reductase gamma subunit
VCGSLKLRAENGVDLVYCSNIVWPDTKRDKAPKNIVKAFEKVFDAKGGRTRGLWLRDGVYYAQMNPSGQKQQYKYRLQGSETVPQALTAMQVLKAKQHAGAEAMRSTLA